MTTCRIRQNLIKRGAWLGLLFIVSTSALYSQSTNVARELQNTFREIAKNVLPVVVEVDTVNVIERRSRNPFEFFFKFPGMPDNEKEDPFKLQPFKQSGVGSGVIVERRGKTVYILTNNHVVVNADEISIKLNDDRIFEGKLVGSDQYKDLALISIETEEDIPLAKLGDSDETWVGDWVLAVGTPLGLESTVTSGIISAKGRTTQPGQGISFTDYLQTDAAINQGNSGGALVNLDGEVIGINTFIKTNSGGNIGLGFAIPINNARRAIDEFINKGSIDYAWLGVSMDDLRDNIAEELDLEGKSGAFVVNVFGDSPAMRANVQPGDLIIKVNNRTIDSAGALSRTVASLSPGKTVPMSVIRNKKTINFNVTLAVRTLERDGLKVNVWPGFSVVPITSELREQMDIPRYAGKIIIGSAVKDSPASSLGLRSGDVIKSINRRNVKNLSHFYDLINSKDKITLKIIRQDEELEFILRK